MLAQVIRNLVKPVRLSEVDVINGNSRFRQVPVLGVLRAGLGNQKIEKLVVTLVLRLLDEDVSACNGTAILFSNFIILGSSLMLSIQDSQQSTGGVSPIIYNVYFMRHVPPSDFCCS